MAIVGPLPSPYYSINHCFVFKKVVDSVTVKVFNAAQECCFKYTFALRELSNSNAQPDSINPDGNIPNSVAEILKYLTENTILPKEYPAYPQEIEKESIVEKFALTVQHCKTKVTVENDVLDTLICPITQDVFKEPVMDEHGHTFEKSAILEWLKNHETCPTSRRPIGLLTPNNELRAFIEKIQQAEPIPTFKLFREENSRLAEQHFTTAKSCIEEEAYQDALVSIANAFKYTRNSHDFEILPMLFLKMGAYEKYILSSVYFANYQFEEGKVDEAIRTLEIAYGNNEHVDSKDQHTFRLLIDLLIDLYEYSHQGAKAIDIAKSAGKDFKQEHPELTVALYKRILNRHPYEFSLYEELQELLQDSNELDYILGRGVIHAIEKNKHDLAEQFCKSIKTEKSFEKALPTFYQLWKVKNEQKLKNTLTEHIQTWEGSLNELKAQKLRFEIDRDPIALERIFQLYLDIKKRKPSSTKWYSCQMHQLDETGRFKLHMQMQVFKQREQLTATTQELRTTREELRTLKARIDKQEEVSAATALRIDLRALPGVTVFDESDWERWFDLSRFGLSFDDASPLDLESTTSQLRTFQEKLSIEEDAGITLLSLPRGLSFNKLVELAQAPRRGEDVKFRYILSSFLEAHGDDTLENTKRIMITNNVLKDTRRKSISIQKELVVSLEYRLPFTLEAAALCTMAFFAKRERLYSNSPRTFTRCEENIEGYPMSVGGFSSAGLNVATNNWDILAHFGVGAVSEVL